MGACHTYIREVRFVIEDELTQVYVLVHDEGDCPMGVRGWHHKTFPKSKTVQQIITEAFEGPDDGYLLWPLNAPAR